MIYTRCFLPTFSAEADSWKSAVGLSAVAESGSRFAGGVHGARSCRGGERVKITGTSREDLNGQAGVATSFDHACGRYVVELDGTSKRGPEKLKVKPVNLREMGQRANKGKKK